MPRRPLALLATALTALLLAGSAGADDKPATNRPGKDDTPPPVLGMTRGGDEIETTQFAGRVMVVTFWATWCGPCRKELVMLEGLQKVAKDTDADMARCPGTT